MFLEAIRSRIFLPPLIPTPKTGRELSCWKPYRINHLSWWKEELASEEEMEEGRNNLAAHDNRVDFIVTHCCASSVQDAIGEGLFQKDRETEYLEEILQTVQFQKWFFGHYHDNRNVDEKKILLYEQIIRVV